MKLKHYLAAVGVVLGVAASVYIPQATAGRNSSGTYSLPTGNPVVSGTSISSTWANTTLTDIGTELTNSLDRAGRGAMTGPLTHSVGSVSAPSVTFTSNTNSGLYRAGSGDIRMSLVATDAQQWTSTFSKFYGSAYVNGDVVVDNLGANAGSSSNWLRFGSLSSGEGIRSKRTATGNFDGLDLVTANVSRVAISNAGAVALSGALSVTGSTTLGSAGTPILSSFGGSFLLAAGTIGAGACVSDPSVVLTGVAVGGVCAGSMDSDVTSPSSVFASCNVTANDTITIKICNVASGSQVVGNRYVRVRVFQ